MPKGSSRELVGSEFEVWKMQVWDAMDHSSFSQMLYSKLHS